VGEAGGGVYCATLSHLLVNWRGEEALDFLFSFVFFGMVSYELGLRSVRYYGMLDFRVD